MTHFPLKTIKTIRAHDIKEAWSGDNLFEENLESNLYSLYLQVRLFEMSLADGSRAAKFEVELKDCDTGNFIEVMQGDWEGLTKFKAKLAETMRELNQQSESELINKCNGNGAESMRLFREFPIGHNFEVTFKSGLTVKAVKVTDRTFAYYDRKEMRFRTPLMTRNKTVSDFPVLPIYAVHNCQYNRAKSFIIKRENFDEVTVFQLVLGQQVGKAKFTDQQCLATFDGIRSSGFMSLNVALHTKSGSRLYKLKCVSDDWRTEAKKSIATKAINFAIHTQTERAMLSNS